MAAPRFPRAIPLVAALLIPAAAFSASKHAAPRHHSSHRSAPKTPAPFDARAANDASVEQPLGRGATGPAALRAQVLLDRAHFSPGEIDGAFGDNSVRAAAAYDAANGLATDVPVSEATWKALDRDAAPVVVAYTITPQDVAGPFLPIPEDMMEKAKLPSMSYSSPLEELAERFHASPRLLQRMNPGARFDTAGTAITALAVDRPPLPKAGSVRVSAGDLSVTALDGAGRAIARFPATVGSEHDPLPVGSWKITGVGRDPVFRYNPDLFWDADAKDEKTTIRPGPNNPVGVVWIDLSKPHYGIHGTAEPSAIGKTESHGCIRLTNWDALDLASVVGPGTPAELVQ
ncbi:MAG TPA: L,D-transpeptidase family protein [Thermoanaerobaculia bacterium]|nr:L,D-transpeptidase family protein [Thermoanaerobaculia bacterium]